jgi:hypothetical protein
LRYAIAGFHCNVSNLQCLVHKLVGLSSSDFSLRISAWLRDGPAVRGRRHGASYPVVSQRTPSAPWFGPRSRSAHRPSRRPTAGGRRPGWSRAEGATIPDANRPGDRHLQPELGEQPHCPVRDCREERRGLQKLWGESITSTLATFLAWTMDTNIRIR